MPDISPHSEVRQTPLQAREDGMSVLPSHPDAVRQHVPHLLREKCEPGLYGLTDLHILSYTSFMKRRLTPKIAGSVIPSEADRAEGIATCFVLLERALRPTARHAPNWAKLAAEAIGIQVLSAPSYAPSIPSSMVLYIW